MNNQISTKVKLMLFWGKVAGWIALSIICLGGITLGFAQARTNQAVLAPEWEPEYLDIGMSDQPSRFPLFGAPEGLAYRQQYLSGGVWTGWTNWNNNADFPKFYIEKSIEMNTAPIFTIYMICQSGHGGASNGNHPCYSREQETVVNNLSSTDIMYQYWAELKILFEKSAEFPNQIVIVHVEPDMWGHLQQLTQDDDARTYDRPIKVGGSGHPDLTGIPDTIQGFADALFHMRDVTGASNVLIAYHASMWGTGTDFALSNPDASGLEALATKSVQFYQTIDQEFDVTFFEVRDRDAGFYQHQYGVPHAWWDQDDFNNHIAWIDRYKKDTGQSVMLWQVPYGNTKRPEMNDTWGHYKDNIVETLFGEEDYATLRGYRNAGVVGVIFGQGASGTTCPCDANHDGVVDDGGYFYEVASKYIREARLKIQITLDARIRRFAQGIEILWNEVDVDSYEVWWGETDNLIPGGDCNSAENCVQVSGEKYRAMLPDGVDSLHYILVTRKNGTVTEVSSVFESIRLDQTTYLPTIRR